MYEPRLQDIINDIETVTAKGYTVDQAIKIVEIMGLQDIEQMLGAISECLDN